MMLRGGLLAAVVAATFVFAVVPAGADHPQDPQGDGTTVTFDHIQGNEWWIEVKVSGNQPFDVVGARDEGGEWMSLDEKSWGVWARSFHIEPGHHVQFEAIWTPHGGPRTESCWFTHPEGVERCDFDPEAAPPADDTTFDHQGGNQWWVQVDVSGSPDRVQAMDTGGPWKELQHKDWGAWAASFHIEPGHDVRFRAMIDGVWQESCWFTHPGGKTPTGGNTCAVGGEEPPPPPPPGEFDAQFDPKPGNEWWVEVVVDANEPLARVDARDDGGPWIALDKKSWGAWAKSFHVEDGSVVEFRARSTDGDRDVSQGYRWPEATPVGDPQPEPPSVDVAFAPKAGNEWWVEAIVVGDHENITSVEGRAEGGSWHSMTYRQWGAWAASFHVPAGSDVQLRATTPNGTDRSEWFTWPDARPVGSDGSWPEEGSYARYDVTISHAPGIMTQRWTDHVYHNGEWWSHSDGWFDYENDGEDDESRSPEWAWGRGAPTFCPTDVQPGDDGCRGLTVEHAETEDTHQEGDGVTVATWYGYNFSESCDGCNDDAGEWDQATGILVGFHNSGTSWSDELLLDTDAPMRTV